MARASRAMATATKRVMATAMKRVMATDDDNTGNGYGEEDDKRLIAATMGTMQKTWLLALRLERGG
jgi:hypothetical protein